MSLTPLPGIVSVLKPSVSNDGRWILFFNVIPLGALAIAFFVSCIPCAFSRALLLQFPLLLSVHQIIGIPFVGGTPEQLYLSDGGHFENLALLPLLQRRLQTIYVAEGSGGAKVDDCGPGDGEEEFQMQMYVSHTRDVPLTHISLQCR